MERKEGLSTKGWFRRLKAVNLGFFEGLLGGTLQFNSFTVDGPQTTAHLIEPQAFFSLVSGEKADNPNPFNY
jgi:hypothetical protein